MLAQPQRIVTGIRATGHLHLGNYFGVLKTLLELQKKGTVELSVFIADYHTLTAPLEPQRLRRQVLDLGRELLAVGMNPKKTTLYLQSAVPEIAELAYLLATVANKGELERVATFKEKARRQPGNVNLALLSYPVLMAADILGLEADAVPVGEDQLQHLEMAAAFARRFNHRYGETFTVPKPYHHTHIRVPALDGSGKMGKSEGNALNLTASRSEVERMVMAAPTDIGKGPLSKAASDLLNFFTLFEPDTAARYHLERRQGVLSYNTLKKELVGQIRALTEPIAKRSRRIKDREVLEILRAGSAAAAARYRRVLNRARTHLGLLNPLR